MRKVFAVFGVSAAVVVAGALVGCRGDATSQSSPAQNDTAQGDPADDSTLEITLVNTQCPIMGGKAKNTVTADWNGQTVGFCCAECIPEWEGLSEEDKASHITAAETSTDGDGEDHEHDSAEGGDA